MFKFNEVTGVVNTESIDNWKPIGATTFTVSLNLIPDNEIG
jgi:hypothetical protein